MILQLCGTSDARTLALTLQKLGFNVLATVVTENAAIELKKFGLDVHVGRLTSKEMALLVAKKNISMIVDASHPFAEEASLNAMEAAKTANIPYIRFERELQEYEHPLITKVETYEQAAEIAANKKGNIMLLTGSKTLSIFTNRLQDNPNIRLIARMLPRKDNLEKCESLGFEQKNIIAMQGPFSKELNIALYKQFDVCVMITKESGKPGSVDEKIKAAIELGIETILISRPRINYETLFYKIEDVVTHIQSELGGRERGF